MNNKVRARRLTGWKATAAVAMSNYIDSGSIIAIAATLTFWRRGTSRQHGRRDQLADIVQLERVRRRDRRGDRRTAGRQIRPQDLYTYDLLVYALGGLFRGLRRQPGDVFAGFVIIASPSAHRCRRLDLHSRVRSPKRRGRNVAQPSWHGRSVRSSALGSPSPSRH